MGGIIGALWPTNGTWFGPVIPHVLVMVVAGGVFAHYLMEPFTKPHKCQDNLGLPSATSPNKLTFIGMVLLGIYVIVQLVVPLRHYAIPGSVHWTEEGHNFSWRMKLRSKTSLTTFTLHDKDGNVYAINPSDHLTREQWSKLPARPDLVWQYAQFLERAAEGAGLGDVLIYGDILISLNGRDFAQFVDKETPLNHAQRPNPLWGHVDWIVPFPKDKE